MRLAALAVVLSVSTAASAQSRELSESEKEREAYAERLRQARADQDDYSERTEEVYRRIRRSQEASATIALGIKNAPVVSGLDDPRFVELSTALGRVRTSTIEALRATLRPVAAVPGAPRLEQASAVLLGAEETARFKAIAEDIKSRVRELRAKRREAAGLLAESYHEQSIVLTDALVLALRRSPELRNQLRSIREETGSELGGEAAQAAIRVSFWARYRLGQLRVLPSAITTSNVISVVWDLSKFILLVLLLFWALRRWDDWMTAAVAAIGQTLTYGQSAVLLIRLAESAKAFGPPLLVLVSAVASYRIFSLLSPEIELALQLTIAISAIRVQLRLVESASANFQRRREEREREQAILAAEASADALDAPTDPPIDPQPSSERRSITRKRTTAKKTIARKRRAEGGPDQGDFDEESSDDDSAEATLGASAFGPYGGEDSDDDDDDDLGGQSDNVGATDKQETARDKSHTDKVTADKASETGRNAFPKKASADAKTKPADKTDATDSKQEIEASELEPFWALFAKTWRRLTRYVGVFVILLVVTNFAVGRGVFYGVLIRWAWLGAIPLTFFFLRTWRPRIVHEITLRASGDEETLLGRLARRHSHRIYGLPIVFAAFLVVLGRRSASFVKRHFFELKSTKKALAFLFRRRVQKHAREHGRVLDKPHSLPTAITSQFGPLRPDELEPLRDTIHAELAAAHASWAEDAVDGSVAVVGESGMGKTCFIEKFAHDLVAEDGKQPVFVHLNEKITEPSKLVAWLVDVLDIPGDPKTEAQLIAALRSGRKRVVVIDRSHHLFLRQVGGFDAWEAFVRIVNETSSRIFWVLSFGKVAWDYLTNVSGRVAYFRRIIRMPAWSEADLRKLIIRRMRRTGYKVSFNDLLVSRIEGVKLTSQIIRTSHGYFRLLWDYADGNPTLACYFWLRSLVPDEKERLVRVNLFAAPSIAELEKLPDDIAFVLTAVVEHESVSISELTAITNLPIALCQFAVRYGKERGYLERNGSRVAISRLWRQTIVLFLKRKHLLYS